MSKWGFLRETSEAAKKAGIDLDTGICRTGLNEYLSVIFPNVNDWIHDEAINCLDNGKPSRKRPDYRSEQLKLIVEFDGVQHYTQPNNILKDKENTEFYEKCGYKVVRIPYFIQLTKRAVKTMFNVEIETELFDETIPSMGPQGKNTPAYLCHSGIKRMAEEFVKYPEQYVTNVEFLKAQENQFLVEVQLLENEYQKICKSIIK